MERDYDISVIAMGLLTPCVDDYNTRIWEVIKGHVLDDLLECTNVQDGEGYTKGDVALAIGRAIASRLGIEI